MEILTAINEEASCHSQNMVLLTGSYSRELSQSWAHARQKRADGFYNFCPEKKDPVKDYLLKQKWPHGSGWSSSGYENKVTYIDNDNKELGHEAVNYYRQRSPKDWFCHRRFIWASRQERYHGIRKWADNLIGCLTWTCIFSSSNKETFKKGIGKIFSDSFD